MPPQLLPPATGAEGSHRRPRPQPSATGPQLRGLALVGALATAAYEEFSRASERWPNPRGSALAVAEAVEGPVLALVIPAMERITGRKSRESGYDAFVEQARIVSETCGVEEQRAFGSTLLREVIPSWLTWVIRSLFQFLESQWPEARVTLARKSVGFFGPIFSYWLVGETRVLEPEEEAVELIRHGADERLARERVSAGPILHIRRCKFLESAGGCKSLCLNLCKVAAEEYMTKEMGLPVYMDPDLETYSCHMRFLEQPVPPQLDPAFSKPCQAKKCDGRFSMPGCDTQDKA